MVEVVEAEVIEMMDMMDYEVSPMGYLIMGIIWSFAGFLGAHLAYDKGCNPIFWAVVCMIAPIALMAIYGMRKAGEPVPVLFGRTQEEKTASLEGCADGLVRRPRTPFPAVPPAAFRKALQ